jgi:hypothetical protein
MHERPSIPWSGPARAELREGAAVSHPESEDMIRSLKSSESVLAAFQAAGFPSPPGDLAQIATAFVKSQTQQIPINRMANMAAGSGQLGASAAQGVNLLIGLMTPMQREAMKAGVNPLDPAAVLRFNTMLNGPAMGSAVTARAMADGGDGRVGGSATAKGERSATSATYTQELAGGASYKALIGQGYAPAHVNSAIDYARHIGASEDMARKFIKLDQNNRDNLHRFVDDMRKSPQLSEAEQKEKIAKFRKENPDIGKTLTDQDILGIVRGKSKAEVKLNGEQGAAHDDKHNKLIDEQRTQGIEKKIDAQHGATVADLSKKPDVNKAEDAELAAIAKQRAAPETPAQPKKADANDKVTPPDPARPKQAARPNPPGPKVT